MRIYVVSLRRLIRTACLLLICSSIVFCGIGAIVNIKNKKSDAYTQALANKTAERIIIIDAGHGGEDPGAVGINGSYEKDLNLEIAMEIGALLTEKGYTVIYTRTEDKMLYTPDENIKGMRKLSDLKNRCLLTEKYEDPILISIHMNTYGASKYSGLQVYYSDKDQESNRLAKCIQSSVKEITQPENTRTVKNGKSLYLLENSNGTAVIIECGFLSNTDECEKLSQKEYQKQLSFSIVCGIINYMNETNN